MRDQSNKPPSSSTSYSSYKDTFLIKIKALQSSPNDQHVDLHSCSHLCINFMQFHADIVHLFISMFGGWAHTSKYSSNFGSNLGVTMYSCSFPLISCWYLTTRCRSIPCLLSMVVCRTVFIMSREGREQGDAIGGRRETQGMEERGDRGRDDSIHLILWSSQLMIAMSNTGWLVPVGTHTQLSRNVRKERTIKIRKSR